MTKRSKKTGKENVVVIKQEANKEPHRTAERDSDETAERDLDQIAVTAIDLTVAKDGDKRAGTGMEIDTETITEVMTHVTGNNTAQGADNSIETDVTSTMDKGPTEATEIGMRVGTLEEEMIVETKGGKSAPRMIEPSLQKEERRGIELRK